MKNLCIIVALLLLFGVNNSSSYANTITGEIISEIDTQNPPKEFCAKITEESMWFGGYEMEKDCVIKGDIVKIIPPKRGKQDAYIVFRLKTFSIPSESKIAPIDVEQFIGVKQYKPLTKGEVAEKVAVGAAGMVVKGLSCGVDLIKGIANAPEGENRIKSGVENVYEGSVISYGRKGYHTTYNKGDLVKFHLEKEIFN